MTERWSEVSMHEFNATIKGAERTAEVKGQRMTVTKYWRGGRMFARKDAKKYPGGTRYMLRVK